MSHGKKFPFLQMKRRLGEALMGNEKPVDQGRTLYGFGERLFKLYT